MEFDFLIVGSGVAGLSFALKASKIGRVAIVTKKKLQESNTNYAQGGIASVFNNDDDNFELHIKDTLDSGDGLCKKEVVERVIKNGPEKINELIKLGVKFDSQDAKLELTREGGHSRKRIVHAQDMTGKELVNVLTKRIKENKNIEIFEDHIAIDLITYSKEIKRGLYIDSCDIECFGAYILDRNTNKIITFLSKITVLSTGGAGKVYLYTSNPDIATGDGIAMAYRAGAVVSNLEFVQFHPTCLYHPVAKNFLISEAVRGEGGILIDSKGYAFMHKYEKEKELACRDKVARAIDNELKKSGDDSVFLDISHKDKIFVKKRFPNLYEKCLDFGINMTKDPIPVVPAAHYMCGGILVDLFGRTNIKNLYAIGETTATGLHGANRLASNSLLEALVYADSAFLKSKEEIKNIKIKTNKEISDWDDLGTSDNDELIMLSHNWDEIRRAMWNYVGIVRSDKRLERAERRIKSIQKEIKEYYWNFKLTADLIELRNIALVAQLIVKCAIKRKESRGLHYNILYPQKKVGFQKDSLLQKKLHEKM